MPDPIDSDVKTKVLKLAEGYLKNDPTPGDNHCAIFVRHVFDKAGYPLTYTTHPSDKAVCDASGYLYGTPQQNSFANSLAGDEIGRKLPPAAAQPGDLILFNNIGHFKSGYAQGTIIHVGICVGDQMMINHGDTRHVYKCKFSDYEYGEPVEARRPKLFDIPRTRIALENGKLTQTFRSGNVHNLDILISLQTSGLIGTLRQKIGQVNLPRITGGLNVFVNNTQVYHYKAVWLKLRDITSGNLYKLSYSMGHTSASLNGKMIPDLTCEMKSGGGSLHVRVNDKEVRSHDAAIEIVYT